MNSTPVTGIQNYTTSRTTDSSSCSDAICIFYAVATLIIFILGLAGNGLVIWIAGFKVKKSVITTWYLSLAVSDFIFCSTLPLYVIYRVTNNWPFGLFMCKFNYFIMWLNMYSSIFLLTIISVDRCVVVMFPVWAQNQRSVRRASVIVMVAWIIAAALSTPSLVLKSIHQNDNEQKAKCRGENHFATVVCRFIFTFVIPFLIMFICYVVIMRKLSNQMLKSRKPIRIMTLLTVMFLICWLPHHTVFLIRLFMKKNNVLVIIRKLTFIFASVNSCLNPFLYAFMGKDIRNQWYALQSKIENAFKEEQDQDTTRGSLSTSSWEKIHSTSI